MASSHTFFDILKPNSKSPFVHFPTMSSNFVLMVTHLKDSSYRYRCHQTELGPYIYCARQVLVILLNGHLVCKGLPVQYLVEWRILGFRVAFMECLTALATKIHITNLVPSSDYHPNDVAYGRDWGRTRDTVVCYQNNNIKRNVCS